MAPTPHSRSERIARLCAETALFMRDHVLSRVSHDLRSPLNAIHSWAYVLERKIETVDAAAQRALGGIRTGVEQQVQLLETLVDKTRAETRKLHVERAPFALDALIGEAVDDVRVALADARAVTLTVHGTPTGATLDGDRERIAQALWLMLMFAVEASAQGAAVTLDVNATAAAAGFEVTWTAAPQALTDEAVPHLLEPFARAQAREPLEAGRAAWVLSLCQRVAEAHGGRFQQQPLVEGTVTALALSVPAAAV
ncbi:MAG: HAMP domain-containing histidine kinase [Paraburkholderia sp.]|uniref:sensor histidine kinase n=1 Tax=Paraburkholderia sp. TaxID=1926495 RepID=UPI00121FA9ED|nr:HAMP domain-containing sensor histidine kinase [Paraburkholderia sp.]TAM03486.1 MAG: HAMP domain-containing histidine kinase [Paraburkholderia sp.]TAM29134.1 MAG: HAMP domain-containing histidine kinase [Paraburkholderia sp.]